MFNDQEDEFPFTDDFIEATGGAPVPAVPRVAAPNMDGEPWYGDLLPDIEIVAREAFREAQLTLWGLFIGDDVRELFKDDYFQWMRRLADIRRKIGDEAVEQIMDDVNRGLGYKLGFETWRVFTMGTQQERDALQRKFHEDCHRCAKKAHDPVTPVAAAEYLRQHPSGVFTDSEGDLWYLSELTDGERESTDSEHDGLVLMIIGPTGQSIRAHKFVFDRPPDWFRPYGLR
jgi:hypothetical protein